MSLAGTNPQLYSLIHNKVKSCMKDNDPSHDIYHVERVTNTALKVAEKLSKSHSIDKLAIEIAALWHDLLDYKYVSTDKFKQIEQELQTILRDEAKLTTERTELILKIVTNCGYQRELTLKRNGSWTQWHESCLEFHCVSDADRLEAIGSFGILRVAAYSGAKNRPLFHNDDNIDTAVSHFYDKLFLLKDTIKTEPAKLAALKRHQTMVNFIQCLKSEIQNDDL